MGSGVEILSGDEKIGGAKCLRLGDNAEREYRVSGLWADQTNSLVRKRQSASSNIRMTKSAA
jgi:hypothetical protein